ncbi:MAG: type II toxin-antitoxin system Phd/YefM family antitoxin [Candidatus Doudnabacteria bacterium]|nr:type II toxin-antitoxin system Phd/YefM family antitoxin [Candidatus Doudnabacteria bacterium]
MDTRTTLPISEARKRIFDIAKEVQKPNIHYVITEKGRPKAVIISAEEFESWVETLEVMRDFPDLKKDIEGAEREYKKGEYITLEEILAREGYGLIKGGKNKHALSSRRTKKGTKRTRQN